MNGHQNQHKIAALVSGGKDSTFSIYKCVKEGHKIVALAHLAPAEGQEEMDSYMYQTVGHNVVRSLETALGVKLYQGSTSGMYHSSN